MKEDLNLEAVFQGNSQMRSEFNNIPNLCASDRCDLTKFIFCLADPSKPDGQLYQNYIFFHIRNPTVALRNLSKLAPRFFG